MNSITVAGQLGRDSEIKTIPSGDQVLSFTVADSQGREKPTIWWRCQLWGKRAASLQQYLVKGQAVTVSGNVTMREYTDKDGTPKQSMDVRVQDVALQGGRKEEQAPRQAAKPAAKQGGSGFDDMDNDIPFVSASMSYDMMTSKARRMARYEY